MTYLDTHCHLNQILDKLGNIPFSQLQAEQFPGEYAGCITISCDPDSIEVVKALTVNASVYAAFGIHPHDAQYYNDDLEKQIHSTMLLPKTVAWGEIGLDYFYEYSDKEIQKQIFRRQIQQAIKCKKPLIIHTRDAEDDTWEIMHQEIPPAWKVHVHCFTSSLAFSQKLLIHFSNLYLGFTGIITFKNADSVREVLQQTPITRLLLETDGPYLAPVPHRGKPAHPGHIPHIAAKMAEIKAVALVDLYAQVRENSRQVYGI